MSSSVFIESSSQAAGDTSDYASTSDSNLVVVYGKNGISFDDKGLENLIEEKKISSISVIRLTSPTPSMQEEEDEAVKLEEMLRRQELGSGEESGASEDEDHSSSGDDKNDTVGNADSSNDENEERKASNDSEDGSSDDNRNKPRKQRRRRGRQPNVLKQKKSSRRRKKERPEIVGLRLEEFYPPEDANEIIKEALKMAGLGADKKTKSDYDFQLFVIQNDHCYTPFTSPTQMKAKLAADKLEAEKQAAANRKTSSILQPTAGKQLFARKKQLQQNISTKSESLAKPGTSSSSFTKLSKKDNKTAKSQAEEDLANEDNDVYSSFDENEDEAAENDESDFSGSDVSAETDNDRDSDLDFDVNNPKGRKRKSKLLRSSIKRSMAVNKVNPKSRSYRSQDEPTDLPNKTINTPTLPTTSPSNVAQRQKSIVKIVSDPGRITVRSTPSKIMQMMGQTNVLSPAIAALPPIPKKQTENKALLNTTSGASTSVTASPKTFVFVKGPIEQRNTMSVQSSPQTHKEIVVVKGPIEQRNTTTVQSSPQTHKEIVLVKGPIEQRNTTTVQSSHKEIALVKGPIEQRKTMTAQSSPQTHKEIVINKQIMSSPKTNKVFTDLTTLIEQSEKQPIKIIGPPSTPKSSAHTATITSVVTLPPCSSGPAALKGFMPIESVAKSQLPAQISIQTHQSSSELEAEHDKQLDLINSIVQDEMQKSNEKADGQIVNINENIPELVKMLESTENVLVTTNTQRRPVTETPNQIQPSNISVVAGCSSISNKSISGGQGVQTPISSITAPTASNTLVGGIDITSASLLATPEGDNDDGDDLPDDILQQVVELIKDDKTLQEAVEKQVFGSGVCGDQGMSNNILVNQNPPPLAPISQPPMRLQETPQPATKSIIQMAISNVPTTLATNITTTPNPVITTRTIIATTPTTIAGTSQVNLQTPKNSPLARKEPIQIIRGNGRVITLPPIEAPTTRAKRRAQAQPNPSTTPASSTPYVPTAALSESSLDSSMHSSSSITLASGSSAATVQEKKTPDSTSRRRGSKETINAVAVTANQKAAKTQKTAAKKGGNKSNANKSKVEAEASDSEEDDDDDPNKLWCICRQPHNNRFMICCDVCEDWFHGTCVSITKAMGLEMEQKGIDWTCPKCVKKQEEKTQPKITEMLVKKPITTVQSQTLHSKPLVIQSTVPASPTLIASVVGTVAPVQTNPITVTSSSIDILNITPKKDSAAHGMEKAPQLKLQSGQIINLKDYSTTTTKRATIIQTSTTNTTPGQKKLYVTSGQASLKMTSQPGTPIRTITVVKQLTTPHQQQHHNIKIIKTIPSATTTAGPSVNINSTAGTASTLVTVSAASTVTPSTLNITGSSTSCIVCKKMARSNSIYCSDDCIRKHAQNALNSLMSKTQAETTGTMSPLNKNPTEDKTKKKSKGLFEELLSAADRKPKVERVNVYERKSGRIITGNSAPTAANLKKWLQDNPTFEVIQPGSTQALDLEKKQKLRVQHSSSPTIQKLAASSPPPLKMFASTSGVIMTNKMETNVNSSHSSATPSPQPQMKSSKTIADFLKSSSSSSSTSPRPSTPKQLQKYPQNVSLKPDKVPKTPEDSKSVTKEKTPAMKRQTSTESSSKSSSNDAEPIRGVVRRTLKEQLLLRIKEENNSTETDAKDESSPTKNMLKLTEEEVEEFAKLTELEMYHYFNRDAGTKYKAKYRSLVFNIKDRKNHTLFAKICGKLIEPKQLVRMTADEMASQELAQWREQENKHQLEMIKKSELDLLSCAKNYVLKTHKGEEVIEGKSSDYANVDITIPVEDVVSALNKSELPDINEASTSIRKDMQTHWSDADSTLLTHSSLLLSETLHSLQEEAKKKDREKEKERDKDKDKDKERSRGRDRERDKRHKSKDRHHDKSRSRKRSRSHSRSRSRDRGEKRHKSSHREEKREREERNRTDKERTKDREQHSDISEKKSASSSSSVTEIKKSTNIQTKQTAKKHQEPPKASINPLDTYNLIDQILESTKTVEEAANLVSEKDKEKELESNRKTVITPQPLQHATSTVSTTSSADSAIVIDIPADLSSMESDQEPSSTVSIPTPPHDPYSRFIACSSPSSSYSSDLQYTIISLWTGNINMVDVTSFLLTLQPITGNSSGLAKLLPKELDVVGRIGPETVWDYISKIKKSPNKEIVVIRLIPANETETLAYKILYEYLDNRNRLGVIKSTSSQIKDFYICPLGAGKTVPSLLQTSEPVDFYDDPYRPDVLIGIIIRVVISKRVNPVSSQSALERPSTSLALSKLSSRTHDVDTFTPPGSPKPKKRHQSKVNEIDIDAIIKAPITAKTQKGLKAPPTKSSNNDADEPYSPGGSSDDDLPLLPVKMSSNMDQNMQAAEDELKRKMEEINRQIAAQEMEIAGLLTGEPTAFGSASSSSTSNVLANISIPSNLSQILASIKTSGKDPSVIPPPPPLIGSLIRNSSSTSADQDYNPSDSSGTAFDGKNKATESNTSSTSLLAKLSEAELLSMVPDDIVITPNSKQARNEEPPPPGV